MVLNGFRLNLECSDRTRSFALYSQFRAIVIDLIRHIPTDLRTRVPQCSTFALDVFKHYKIFKGNDGFYYCDFDRTSLRSIYLPIETGGKVNGVDVPALLIFSRSLNKLRQPS